MAIIIKNLNQTLDREALSAVRGGFSDQGGNLEMVQLQSLVSQRQVALQIATNLMQATHESSRQILGNIR